MSFKLNDKVRVKTSGKTGKIVAILDCMPIMYGDGFGDDEYQVEFDDGSGAITLVERVLEKIYEVKCTCGVVFVRHADRHSDYCDLYTKEF